jgi:hypothetical protein
MKQYKLVNENRGVDICKLLDRLVSSEHKFYDAFEKLPNFISKPLSKFNTAKEKLLFKKWVNLITKSMHTRPNTALNHYLTDDWLSLDEAIFYIMGLNPMAIEMISDDPRVPKNRKITSVLLKHFVLQTAEGRGLYKASRTNNSDGFVSDEEDKVNTKELISWAIKKGFITEVDSLEKTNKLKKTPRASTIEQQDMINNLAKKIVEKYPEITQEMLANEISNTDEVKISEGTIRRNYLDKYPNF